MTELSRNEDHRAMIMALGDLKRDIGELTGKVDSVHGLLERQSERQDRADNRVDRLESEFKDYRDRTNEKITDIKIKTATYTGGLAVAMGFLTVFKDKIAGLFG